MRVASCALLLLLSPLVGACGEDPPPGGGGSDLGIALDVGFLSDAETTDLGLIPDSGLPPDTGVPDDTGVPEDTGIPGDTGVPEDTGVPGDSGLPADTGVVPDGGADGGVDGGLDAGPDAGFPLTDGDGDGIADRDEGNGTVDTDGDGTPDTSDTDSDNDGSSDADEAGDNNLNTPPRDSDGDGTADFRDLDSDNDLIPDATEGSVDTDGDGQPNRLDLDSDGDTIADRDEGAGNPDNDGLPNYLDDDSDQDGLSDAVEAGDTNPGSAPRDTDFDGTANFLDSDSDNDTISDAFEGNVDSDGDGIVDSVDVDSDNDAVLDLAEAGDADLATAPFNTDGDPQPDFRDLDSDGDTIADLVEAADDVDNDGTLDRYDLDSDNDGVPDAVEAGDANLQTAPVDTDNDGPYDYQDLDSDGDGLADANEPGCPTGSSRILADSDADGFLDLAEIGYGSNPCNAQSRIDDFYFVLPPGGPGDDAPLVFSDTNIDRADLAINVDTTGSMGGEIANLRNGLSTTIIPGVGAAIPDAAFAISSFEDYPVNPFGQSTASDLPFRLGTRVTSNAATAQTAVNALTTRNGLDFPESGNEALYQITTGVGTSWTGGSVPAFNPATGLVPGVADGTIGGVGFRDDALPVVVHVTDAVSHTRRDYQAVQPAITAVDNLAVRNALAGVGARVVTISSGLLPFNDLLCSGGITTFFGAISTTGADVDWFQLQGAVAGNTVSVEVFGDGYLSNLDAFVAIANSTGLIATDDDSGGGTDAALTNVALTGTGPFYVAITAFGDADFNGSGGTSNGHWLANVSLNGNPVMPSPTVCRVDEGNNRGAATTLVAAATAQPPANPDQCEADCDLILGGFSPLFQDFTFPYELSEDTGAVIPPCAWSEFGAGRPAGCAANQCCTGQNGAGVDPNAAGLCPLAFEISDTGAGLDTAVVQGIQALVNFSTFTITTVVRPDPAQLIATGLDTTCFIHGVIPVSATPPNTCAPTPTLADLVPPSPELDSFENVVPGTVLEFDVNALNVNAANNQPCVNSTPIPQQFRAFIDVVADGVTVVDTRDVIIIVPPVVPGGGG